MPSYAAPAHGAIYLEYDIQPDFDLVLRHAQNRLWLAARHCARADRGLVQRPETIRHPAHTPNWKRLLRSSPWVEAPGRRLEDGPRKSGACRIALTPCCSVWSLAQQKVASSQARMEGIVDAAMDAIITVDRLHRIVATRRAALDLFGFELEEVLGKFVEMLIPHDTRHHHGSDMEAFAMTGVTRRRMSRQSVVAAYARRYGIPGRGIYFPLGA